MNGLYITLVLLFLENVLCNGGPGLLTVVDRYNSESDMNREFAVFEPQQLLSSWVSGGGAFKVQFTTTENIKKANLIYWSSDENDAVTVDPLKTWEFIDSGEQKRSQHMHSFVTQPLATSTVYYYKVETTDENDTIYTSNVHQIHTPSDDNVFKFLAAGDIGISNAVSMPILKQLAQSHDYDFVTIMGDQGYDLSDFEGRKGDQFMNFAQGLYANLPVLATPGNHDDAYNASHFKNRFNIMPNEESGWEDSTRYSFNYKSLHLVSFPTELFFDEDEHLEAGLDWLENDLAKATEERSERPWIIVFGHRPLYCTIETDVDCTKKAKLIRYGPDKNRGLETILSKYNVDMYMSGHKHNYERTYPLKDSNAVSASYHNSPSFLQVITGNAGNHEGPESFTEAEVPSWLGHRYEGYGFTSLQVSPQFLDIQHIEANVDGSFGNIIDQVRLSKSTSHVNKQKIVSH